MSLIDQSRISIPAWFFSTRELFSRPELSFRSNDTPALILGRAGSSSRRGPSHLTLLPQYLEWSPPVLQLSQSPCVYLIGLAELRCYHRAVVKLTPEFPGTGTSKFSPSCSRTTFIYKLDLRRFKATTYFFGDSKPLTVRRRFKATSYFFGDSKPRHIPRRFKATDCSSRRFKATSYFFGDSKPRHISSAIQSQHVYGDSKPRNILLRATHRPVSSFSTSVAALQPLYDERLIRQASPAAACSRPPFLFNRTSPSPARLVCIDDDCRIFFCAWYIVLDKKTLDFLDSVHWYLYMFFLNRLAFIGRFFLSPTCLHWPVYYYVCIFIAMQSPYFVTCRMSWCLSSYFCINTQAR